MTPWRVALAVLAVIVLTVGLVLLGWWNPDLGPTCAERGGHTVYVAKTYVCRGATGSP